MNNREEISVPVATSLTELVAAFPDFGSAPALLSPGRSPLSFMGLHDQIGQVGAFLNAHGIGRGDRVAAALPNGPEAAAAFLGVAAAATYAPLNPAFQDAEFFPYLQDLHPQALLIPSATDSPARAAAASLGIPLIELEALPSAGAGCFRLSSTALPERAAGRCGPGKAEDTALVLHTSGTTSRPKYVPLLHRQVLASTWNTRIALELTRTDRCLNLMPLFHLSGLITAVLATLSAGGSLVCTPGFSPAGFFEWLETFQPTWYTAVPTFHQAIASHAEANPPQLTSLRQIRSSAASLPRSLSTRLEQLFKVPVIESYGMTETQLIASNPLPPRVRKAGSVGLPAGPEVALMDADGGLLPRGGTGEIVLRGPNVFSGYEDNPAATAEAFRDGWFRTGDLGRFDEDGYLFISGRAKDLINRGGQKVSPTEVEAILLTHPAVREAVAFPMAHASLGEAVAAAVVLAPGTGLREQVMKDFLAERLAPYKVPQRIIRVQEIPTGTTGKIQRNTLAGIWKDWLASAVRQEPPSGPEEFTSGEWAEALSTEAVLRRHPAVLRCAVLPRHDAYGRLHLVAFAVLDPAGSREHPVLFVLREGPECLVPTAFVGLDAMPRDAEGRVDWIKLRTLQPDLDPVQKPHEIDELILARIWEEVLPGRKPALGDDFFQSGGDSLKAVDLLLRIEEEVGVAVAPQSFSRHATLEALVLAVRQGGQTPTAGPYRVQAGTGGRPFFFMHGDYNGWGFHCPRFARLLGEDQAFITFHPDGMPGQPYPTTLEAMADRFFAHIREIQPHGPYHLGGYCNGGLVAFEIAKRLRAAAEPVEPLVLISPPHAGKLGIAAGAQAAVPQGVQILKQTALIRRVVLGSLYSHAIKTYRPGFFPGTVHLLATDEDLKQGDGMGWQAHAEQTKVHRIPGDHRSIFSTHLENLAACLAPILAGAATAEGNLRSSCAPGALGTR